MMTVLNNMLYTSGGSTHPCRRPWQTLNHEENSLSSSGMRAGIPSKNIGKILISKEELQNGYALPIVAQDRQISMMLPEQ